MCDAEINEMGYIPDNFIKKSRTIYTGGYSPSSAYTYSH